MYEAIALLVENKVEEYVRMMFQDPQFLKETSMLPKNGDGYVQNFAVAKITEAFERLEKK